MDGKKDRLEESRDGLGKLLYKKARRFIKNIESYESKCQGLRIGLL